MTERAQYRHDLILRTLRMDEDTHRHLVYEQGVRYVEIYLEHSREQMDIMLAMPEYWAWWERQWTARDGQFYRNQDIEYWSAASDKWTRSLLCEFYYMLHDAEFLDIRVERNAMQKMNKAYCELRNR